MSPGKVVDQDVISVHDQFMRAVYPARASEARVLREFARAFGDEVIQRNGRGSVPGFDVIENSVAIVYRVDRP